MNFLTATAAPVVRFVGETRHEFPRLTRGELGVLMARWGEAGRKVLRAAMEEAALPAEKRFAELRVYDEQVRLVSYLRSQLFVIGNAEEAVLESMRKHDPRVTQKDLSGIPLSLTEVIDLAFEVCGFEPVYHVPPQEEPADPKAGSPGTDGSTGSRATSGSDATAV